MQRFLKAFFEKSAWLKLNEAIELEMTMVPTDTRTITRLDRGQSRQIEDVRDLRAAATSLRSSTVKGSYDDDQLHEFWRIVSDAGVRLRASNSELAERAGLGSDFFASVTRDRRRPKLANFLRALTVVIDVANERLLDVERTEAITSNVKGNTDQLIISEWKNLLVLSSALERIARAEIDKLDSENPNDPDKHAETLKQRELLSIFADGFGAISRALEGMEDQKTKLTQVKEAVLSVSDQLKFWWNKNGNEVIDWTIRLPFFSAGVGMLNLVGANMPIATSAVAVIVGGQKIVNSLAKMKKKK